MHRSRLSGIVIDCRTGALAEAARFWGEALGMNTRMDASGYVALESSARALKVLVQSVAHESRVHLDIETDNLEAEVLRLTRLGAARIARVKNWWVMQAPTGQRFCIVGRSEPLSGAGIHDWE
jgi:Glyoxalase-like domain